MMPALKTMLVVTVGALTFMASMLSERPRAPKFLRAPSFAAQSEPLHIETQITPHPDIRHVGLDAWTADVDPDTGAWSRQAYVTGSSRQVTDPAQRTFIWDWRAGTLPEGRYILVAKIITRLFVALETRHNLEVV